MLPAQARPSPAANRALVMLTTDWLSDRLPLLRTTNARSPGCEKVCILRAIFRSSKPALVRESEAITRPSRVMMPRQ